MIKKKNSESFFKKGAYIYELKAGREFLSPKILTIKMFVNLNTHRNFYVLRLPLKRLVKQGTE